MNKKILYIDMDGVLFDFDYAFQNLPPKLQWIEGQEKEVPEGFFRHLPLIEGAKDAVHELAKFYEIFILSTPQWSNHNSYTEKALAIKDSFPEVLFKRLILSHDKTLLRGNYLIDDRVQKGVLGRFEGEHIHFGSGKFQNWATVVNYLADKDNYQVEHFNASNPHYKSFMETR